jgi:hypothetical protein
MLTLDGYEDYRRFVDKLSESNVDKYIDLPMIAVICDTSSGKSSLLSAISMIELPSSDELTTRCPIMLRMSRCDKRTATVEVIWKDTPRGKSGEEIAFSPKIVGKSNWDELTECIAAVQQHIIKWSVKEVAQNDILNADCGECPPDMPSGSVFINPSNKVVRVAKPNLCYDTLHGRALSKVRRDPDWIRKLIKKYRPLKLPIFLNTEVFAKIVAKCMDKDWQGPSLDLVAAF